MQLFSDSVDDLSYKWNYYPPPLHKLYVRPFLGTFRLVSSETALQKVANWVLLEDNILSQELLCILM